MVGRQGLVLLSAVGLDLGTAQRCGASGVGLHDEGDAVPEAADVRAADLVSASEIMVLHEAPVRMEPLEDSAPARGVEEGGGSGSLDARRAAGDSKGEAALDGVEVGILGEG